MLNSPLLMRCTNGKLTQSSLRKAPYPLHQYPHVVDIPSQNQVRDVNDLPELPQSIPER